MQGVRYSPAKRLKILAYMAEHGITATEHKFKVPNSTVYKWRERGQPTSGSGAGDRAKPETTKSSSHSVVLLLRQSDRAFRAGHETKAHLLAMLALETLEGR